MTRFFPSIAGSSVVSSLSTNSRSSAFLSWTSQTAPMAMLCVREGSSWEGKPRERTWCTAGTSAVIRSDVESSRTVAWLH